VRQGGRDVRRIYRTTGGTSRAGFAATLDDAKAEWKAAYAAMRIAPNA
jgi:hypothetical protein